MQALRSISKLIWTFMTFQVVKKNSFLNVQTRHLKRIILEHFANQKLENFFQISEILK